MHASVTPAGFTGLCYVVSWVPEAAVPLTQTSDLFSDFIRSAFYRLLMDFFIYFFFYFQNRAINQPQILVEKGEDT